MSPFTLQSGFSYIEILLAMSLSLIFMVSLIDSELLAVQSIQASLQKTINSL